MNTPIGASSFNEAKRLCDQYASILKNPFHVIFDYYWDKCNSWKILPGTGHFNSVYEAY